MANIYQTLDGFLANPFNNEIKDDRPKEFEDKYQIFKRSNRIQVVSILEMNFSYFIHIKIPSESHSGTMYDVVIQFFSSEESKARDLNIESYYIKFFSNSPSFVYRYSALYYANDFLIDALTQFYDEEALKVLPEKTNSKMELYYDKSIYFACRFLLDHKKQYLSRIGMAFKRTTNFNRFISKIQDTETIKLSNNVSQLERGIKKDISNDRKTLRENSEKEKKKNISDNRHKDKVVPKNKIAPLPKKGAKKKIQAKKSTLRR